MALQRDTFLRFFEQVRSQLIEAGIRELAGNWDIREENEAGLLGYCHSTQVDEWVAIDDETKLSKFVVDYIGMRLIPDETAHPCRDEARAFDSTPFSVSSSSSSSSSSHCSCPASSSMRSHKIYPSSSSSSSSSYAASSSPVCTCSSVYIAQAVFPTTTTSTLPSLHVPIRYNTTEQQQEEPAETAEEEGRSKMYYPLETLLPTLLHEFAHVLAPPCLRLKSATGKRGRKWEVESHGSDFYQAFARILRVAEELNIFALPNTPNKLSMKALSRFDRIDLEAFALSPKSVLPNSYALLSTEQKDPNVITLETAAAPVKPIRVTLSASVRGKPVIKPAVIDHSISWHDFLISAKDKLRLTRIPSSVRDKQGTIVTESTFHQLKQDQTLVFSSK